MARKRKLFDTDEICARYCADGHDDLIHEYLYQVARKAELLQELQSTLVQVDHLESYLTEMHVNSDWILRRFRLPAEYEKKEVNY